MNIVGISAFYHQSACCLLQDGRLVAAVEEERFSRVKHDRRLPVHAFRYCLEAGGLDITDVDAVAYYERPVAKLGRQLWSGTPLEAAGQGAWLDPHGAERSIRRRLGFEGPLLTFPHHASHAASAYYFSGFEEAAILTVDGVGEWATTTYGRGRQGELEVLEQVCFPHSMGLLYSAVTAFLGFRVNDGELKVMGLAPYGTDRLAERLAQVVLTADDHRFALDLQYFDFLGGGPMFSPRLAELLGGPPRRPGEPMEDFHRDVARAVQIVLQELLLQKVEVLHDRVGGENLCLAGGVAYNCVANGAIRRQGPFRRLFVPPAAGDSGAALGAAMLAHRHLEGQLGGEPPPVQRLLHAHWGPAYSSDCIGELLAATGLEFEDYRQSPGSRGPGLQGESELLQRVAEALEEYRVVGWFHGALEFGPRALGGRSILANPLDPQVRDRLNRSIKRREAFRPFAPAVLAEKLGEHFELPEPAVEELAPFMLETCSVTSKLDLPGITHVDGSARPQAVFHRQTPRFAELLRVFERRTGCPLLVNTSFNVRGEPIVCSPVDALFCFADAGLDLLVLEDFVLDARRLPAGWRELLEPWRQRRRSAFAGGRGDGAGPLYTFV
ncbi:MAG: carbamoyltransferase N-terminal domain-containing protein [Acidobacteriota bacterium]|nr:carbamoyltransferase N-terminal domain-containing protein [Acidobacteriota bacterium]